MMTSLSSARQSEVKAWEEDITACEHTLCLEQFESAPIAASGFAHCKSQGEPVALSYVWIAWMREEAIRRRARRERTWVAAL